VAETILKTLECKKHKSVSLNGKETMLVQETVLEPKCHIVCLALFSTSEQTLHKKDCVLSFSGFRNGE
jgi:hypothetical protein